MVTSDVCYLATPTGLHPKVDEFIGTLVVFNCLWQDDLHLSVKKFAKSAPSQQEWVRRVEEMVEQERKVSYVQETREQASSTFLRLGWWQVESLPDTIFLAPLLLVTSPLKSTLSTLASNWKLALASSLHKQAKVRTSCLPQVCLSH